MNKKSILVVLILSLATTTGIQAQTAQKNYFSKSSPMQKDDKDYGVINISAEKNTVVLGTLMAYGENVKGLTIRINNGFPFKLAPAQDGTILNYVAPGLNIVLQPGDKARIEFSGNGRNNSGVKQIYVSGEIAE